MGTSSHHTLLCIHFFIGLPVYFPYTLLDMHTTQAGQKDFPKSYTHLRNSQKKTIFYIYTITPLKNLKYCHYSIIFNFSAASIPKRLHFFPITHCRRQIIFHKKEPSQVLSPMQNEDLHHSWLLGENHSLSQAHYLLVISVGSQFSMYKNSPV